MRHLFLLLALLGLGGIALGVLAVVRGSAGPFGVPFSYENYGGPGSIIAGLMLLAGSLYLRSIWRENR
jgi:formate hydrogenlyase subunit 3/multisubunit Na+/H+ antiporter MnhD subunit